MNEKDIMNALGGIDDELLAEIDKKPRNLKGSWKVLIAAALIMAFSVTAYAIGSISTSYKTRVVDTEGLYKLYYGNEEEAEFYEMKVEYQLEPQKVNKDFYNEIAHCLESWYITDEDDYNENEPFWASMDYIFSKEGKEIGVYTVEELEDYIGIDFNLSEEMRAGINRIAKLKKEGKTSMNPCSVTVTGKKASGSGKFVPLSFTVTFLADYDGKGNFVYGAAFVSLSDEKKTCTTVWNSFEKEGEWTEEIVKTDSGKMIYFIHNNPEEGFRSSARACWSEDGIGYSAYTGMAMDWKDKDKAAEHLLPFVENIK